MIYLAQSFGNNSNIFFQHVHLDAFCRQNELIFVNPFILRYGDIFPSLVRSQPKARVSYLNGLLHRAFAKNFDGSRPDEAEHQWLLSCKSKDVWVKGWGFRAKDCVSAMQKEYRKMFEPAGLGRIERDSENLKRNGRLLSVHIRRGDYRRWLEGRYCYDDDVYRGLIKRALDANPDIGIVQIFSNEPVDIGCFEKLGVEVVFPGGQWYEDQWKMALGDFIIGPPSTFSYWASYLGEVPIWHVETPQSEINWHVA